MPDLATSLPAPDRRRQDVHLPAAPGIRYSTGALVRPADFRRAIERALLCRQREAPTASTSAGIVGAAACLKTPKRCDLSQGIVTDPASNTVTFHLTAPDPDFLYKLALPAAYAVPAGTPLKARLPLPATGPYMIASYDPKHGSGSSATPASTSGRPAAQPSGYPDEIVLTFGVTSPERRSRASSAGRPTLHASKCSPSRAPVCCSGAQYASQLHTNPAAQTSYFFLNTRVPPFDDVRVRQAVNYAVDRNRMESSS